MIRVEDFDNFAEPEPDPDPDRDPIVSQPLDGLTPDEVYALPPDVILYPKTLNTSKSVKHGERADAVARKLRNIEGKWPSNKRTGWRRDPY
jgi:hypothetical protein